MKLSTVSLSLVLATTASTVSALPRFGFGQRGRNGFQPSRGNSGSSFSSAPAGAAYFITNEPSGNFIVATEIGQDGKLTFSRAVSAAGRGQHNTGSGPDGLFSQGSIKVGGQNLFVVNPGSNTVSMFSINPRDPTNIQMVGNPVSSEGEFPVSIAVNSKASMICALNGGAVNGVSCYTPDSKLGLIQVPNSVRSLGLNQTTPATGPEGTVSHLLFNEAGNQLIASVKGVPPNPGFLATWDVAADGSLSPEFNAITPPSGGLLPFGMDLVQGNGNAVFVTDAGIGFDVFDLSASSSNSSGTTAIPSLAATNVVAGGASSANAVGGQKAVCWAAFSPKAGNFFVTDIGTSTVTEVNVDPQSLKANIVKQYPLTAGSATIDDAIASVKGNDFLYVLAPNATSVDVLSVPGAGQAKRIQTLNFAPNMRSAKVTINANNLQGMTVFVN